MLTGFLLKVWDYSDRLGVASWLGGKGGALVSPKPRTITLKFEALNPTPEQKL